MNNPHVLLGVKIGLDLQVIVQDNVRHNGCLQAASYFALFLCSVFKGEIKEQVNNVTL